VRQVAASYPAAARQALLNAYHVGFSASLNHLMDIGAIVAFVGAVCGFALVRQRDFVVPTGPGAAAPPGAVPEDGEGTAAGAGVPVAHG
jgi:hypothetical protein